ncbi:MAG: phosphate acyltransferase PlsX [Spirochaetota bacterium]
MVAVDVMSGERPPETIIRGAARAVVEHGVEVILVGDEECIKSTLNKIKFDDWKRLKIQHASEVIGMHEVPSIACKKKKDASIMVCTKLVKEGIAEGVYSPGNTGAALVASVMNMGKLEGVYRPALSSYIPTAKGHSLLIDAGANVDCIPEYLAQFAIMGEVFAKKVQGKKNPSIGILSIGREKSKGNDLTLKTYNILKELDINFVGNIEGFDISDGDVDVIVCDGFTGNITLKVTERVFQLTFEYVAQEVESHLLQRIGYALLYPAVKNMNKKIDHREFGGAPLLGLEGSIVIGHGIADALAAYNGVRMVNSLVKNKFNDLMLKRLDEFGLRKRINSS